MKMTVIMMQILKSQIRLIDQVISLPMHTELDDDQIDFIASTDH